MIQKIPLISYKKIKYAAKIGYIIYIIIENQIYIAFAILIISCFAKNLGPDYFSTVDQILRYKVSSPDKSITFGEKLTLHLVRYSNSD